MGTRGGGVQDGVRGAEGRRRERQVGARREGAHFAARRLRLPGMDKCTQDSAGQCIGVSRRPLRPSKALYNLRRMPLQDAKAHPQRRPAARPAGRLFHISLQSPAGPGRSIAGRLPTAHKLRLLGAAAGAAARGAASRQRLASWRRGRRCCCGRCIRSLLRGSCRCARLAGGAVLPRRPPRVQPGHQQLLQQAV